MRGDATGWGLLAVGRRTASRAWAAQRRAPDGDAATRGTAGGCGKQAPGGCNSTSTRPLRTGPQTSKNARFLLGGGHPRAAARRSRVELNNRQVNYP